MKKSAVAIRHLAFEDLGILEPLLQKHGYALTLRDAGLDPLDDTLAREADLLVVLGGPIGVYDSGDYPFLSDEIRLIEQRVKREKPALGICLGAQLIARALGARVYASGSTRIGFDPVTLTDAGERSALAPLAGHPEVLHWHGDTFDLPEGAERLAQTAEIENQAFAYPGGILGLQFHLEADLARLDQWLIGHTLELRQTAGLSPAHLRKEAGRLEQTMTETGQAVFDAYLAGLDA